MNYDKEIDTCGLNCPLPILKAKKALTDMTSGQVLQVRATDPGSVRDFEAFARQTGNDLVSSRTEGEQFIFRMRRR
jgi:TusA-related sulfurtransferase